jgi:hypothetical protein
VEEVGNLLGRPPHRPNMIENIYTYTASPYVSDFGYTNIFEMMKKILTTTLDVHHFFCYISAATLKY